MNKKYFWKDLPLVKKYRQANDRPGISSAKELQLSIEIKNAILSHNLLNFYLIWLPVRNCNNLYYFLILWNNSNKFYYEIKSILLEFLKCANSSRKKGRKKSAFLIIHLTSIYFFHLNIKPYNAGSHILLFILSLYYFYLKQNFQVILTCLLILNFHLDILIEDVVVLGLASWYNSSKWKKLIYRDLLHHKWNKAILTLVNK